MITKFTNLMFTQLTLQHRVTVQKAEAFTTKKNNFVLKIMMGSLQKI